MQEENYLELKKFCQDLGLDLFGVADISAIKKEFLLSSKLTSLLNAAISIGARLSQGVLLDIEDAPTRLYFHHYRCLNAFLDQCALKLASFIQKRGFLAVPIAASQIVDWSKQTAHLSHKRIGFLAGLGWIGRNNLLVNKEFGSHFRLATVLTDMPLKKDKPLNDSCGNCRRCLAVCPAKAIKEDPAHFDHLRCFEKLKEFQKRHLVDQYICGVCLLACSPPGQK